MDIVFDVDGALTNPKHRLHFVNDTAYWKIECGSVPKPDWRSFLASEQLAGDAPIPEIWETLTNFVLNGDRILFITDRPENQRKITLDWLTKEFDCPIRGFANQAWDTEEGWAVEPCLLMRSNGDRRPSHVVKGELLDRARADGFEPTMAFEDCSTDTAMWREKGLLCLQVADGITKNQLT